MNAELIMFGIEAGVKLGAKLNDVLVDATVEKPMLLPVGELFYRPQHHRCRHCARKTDQVGIGQLQD